MTFSSFLNQEIIPFIHSQTVPELAEPMIYSLKARGKHIRPILLLLCSGIEPNTQSQQNRAAFYVAAAIEVIHTYSLIHDDLPAMDDDDMRRGQASCHIHYSEWAAILAGDALQSLAFELLAIASQLDINLNLQRLIICLARASGMQGMVAGQTLDLSSEREANRTIGKANEPQNTTLLLKEIHQKKTGALFCASCELAAICTNCQEISPYQEYGQNIGLLFQIKDDLLDALGDAKTMGKATNKDIDKLTYPAVFGLEASERMCKELEQELTQLAHRLVPGVRSQKDYRAQLSQLPNFVLERTF